MTEITEKILNLICQEEEISIREIKNTLHISTETLNEEMSFLADFGFVQLDKTVEFVRLSNWYKKFVNEIYVDL